MKKLFLGVVATLLFSTAGFANSIAIEQKKDVLITETEANAPKAEGQGRQCCTRSMPGPNGTMISMTACAGSFLMSDDNAMTKACAKASAALLTSNTTP